jgi:glycosyltransferase involved in cell wall biosynthesis
MTQLMEYISKHGLHSNIRLLGLIDYSDVVRLIRHSISVVNPSLFEGWSTTVEEARALGKSIILSNINVHREQDPPNGVYFAPMDAVALSDIMESQYENYPARSKDALDQASQSKSQERARRFAIDYENIVLELVSTTS